MGRYIVHIAYYHISRMEILKTKILVNTLYLLRYLPLIFVAVYVDSLAVNLTMECESKYRKYYYSSFGFYSRIIKLKTLDMVQTL